MKAPVLANCDFIVFNLVTENITFWNVDKYGTVIAYNCDISSA